MNRETQLEMCLSETRDYLKDIQRRYEAAEQSWARTCQHLQAESDFYKSRVRAYDAFQLPGAAEVAQLAKQASVPPPPPHIDSQALTARLNQILGKVGL